MNSACWCKYNKPLLLLLLLTCFSPTIALAGTWYVAIDGSNTTGDGSSSTPYASIQHAADLAASGDTINLGSGLFVGAGNRDVTFGNTSLTILSSAGPDATTIDCEGSSGTPHRAMSFLAGIDSTFKVVGITFKNGYDATSGGLVLINPGCSPKFDNCRFELGEAFNGGAVYLDSAGGTFVGCSFASNNSDNLGGALFIEAGSYPGFEGCEFIGNTSDQYAGVVMVGVSAEAAFTNCLFTGSGATWGGGVLYASEAAINFTGCTFVKSEATWTGDVLAFLNSDVELTNSLLYTIAGSEAVVCLGSSTISIACTNIFSTQYVGWFGACVTPQFGTNGNIAEDPLFIDYDDGDFRLQTDSPCNPANNSCAELLGSEPVLDQTDDCGDLDGDGLVSISDAVYAINYIFADGPVPLDSHNGDMDCSGDLIITDCVYLINYIFINGAAPCDGCQ